MDRDDTVVTREDGVEMHNAYYDEGILTGYRWYDENNIEPMFDFGHGLSYTTFKYSDMEVKEKADDGESVGYDVTFTLTNTCDVKGSEVAQIYLGEAEVPSGVQMAKYQLAGYERVEDLEPGESRKVTVHVSQRSLSYWNTDGDLKENSEGTKDKWTVAEGERKIYVGAAEDDLILNATVNVTTEKVEETVSDLSKAEVSSIADQVYTGSAITPQITVKIGDKTLTEHVDYEVSFVKNKNVGTAKAVITGIGEYTGTKTVTFNIVEFNGTQTLTPQTYTGKKIKYSIPRYSKDGKTYKEGKDYSLKSKNNKNAGTATLELKWKGSSGQKGTEKYEYTILPASADDTVVESIKPVKLGKKKAAQPTLKVKFGRTKLKIKKDYTVSYSDNTAVGTGKAEITFKGNYTGTKTVTFEITK